MKLLDADAAGIMIVKIDEAIEGLVVKMQAEMQNKTSEAMFVYANLTAQKIARLTRIRMRIMCGPLHNDDLRYANRLLGLD